MDEDFTLDVVDFDGGSFSFEGVDGLVNQYGAIMVAAQSNVAVSAVGVDLFEDEAVATFKFINSVTPPPQLDLELDETLLLFADNEATFVRQDGVWTLTSLQLVHSLAYPGSIDGH